MGERGETGVSGQDGEDADKVNECMNENNGGCQDVCINAQGGYYCACNKGRQLGAAPSLNCDGKSTSFRKICTVIMLRKKIRIFYHHKDMYSIHNVSHSFVHYSF